MQGFPHCFTANLRAYPVHEELQRTADLPRQRHVHPLLVPHLSLRRRRHQRLRVERHPLQVVGGQQAQRDEKREGDEEGGNSGDWSTRLAHQADL